MRVAVEYGSSVVYRKKALPEGDTVSLTQQEMLFAQYNRERAIPRERRPDWANNKDSWSKYIRKYKDVNPFSVFGMGCKTPSFQEIFSTPNFRRGAQIALKRNPANSNIVDIVNEPGRAKLLHLWNKDVNHDAFNDDEKLTPNQVKAYLQSVSRTRSLSDLVFDKILEPCSACWNGMPAEKRATLHPRPPTPPRTPFKIPKTPKTPLSKKRAFLLNLPSSGGRKD